ncbi:hypothetical protein ACFFRR_006099 [Megaselia abdita]
MSSYENIIDEFVPEWLNKEYILSILRNDELEGQQIKISKYNLLNPTKGEHFASTMFFGELFYSLGGEEKTKHIIIKILPQGNALKTEALEGGHVFETESKIYHETIPKFEAILSKYGDNSKLGAKMIFHSLVKDKEIIVLENLKQRGFTSSGLEFTNYEEALLSIERIAKWHACSMKLNNEGDMSMKDYSHGSFNLKNIDKMSIFSNGIQVFNEFLESQEDLVKFRPYFKKMEKTLLKKVIKTYSDNGRVRVLNHGDFHCNNVMLKHFNNDRTKPEDVMLIDFQFCVWGPVVIDLMYGIHTFFKLDFRTDINNRDKIIKFYFDHLVETLEKIEYRGEIPTLKDIHKDLVDQSHMEIFFLTTFMPLSMMYENATDFEKMDSDKLMNNSGDNGVLKFYYYPQYVAKVKELLPLYLNRGWLDGFDEL